MSDYTTILVHRETRERLATVKDYARESYEEVINKLISVYEKLKAEGELSAQAKSEVETARKEIKAGKGVSTKKLMADLGL